MLQLVYSSAGDSGATSLATHRHYHNELKAISTVWTPKLPSRKPKLGQLRWFSLAASTAWAHICVCRPALHQARDSAWTSSRPGGQRTAHCLRLLLAPGQCRGPAARQEQQGEPHGLSSVPQLLLGGLGTHKDGLTAGTGIGVRCISRICWEQMAAVSFLAKQSRELSSNWMRWEVTGPQPANWTKIRTQRQSRIAWHASICLGSLHTRF